MMTMMEMQQALEALHRLAQSQNELNGNGLIAQEQILKSLEQFDKLLANLSERLVFLEDTVISHAKVITHYSEVRDDADEAN